MLRICLALLAGAYALQFFKQLPPDGLLIFTAVAATAFLAWRSSRIAGLVLVGFCAAWHASAERLADRLSPEFQDSTIVLVGRVHDFPEQRGDSLRFVMTTRAVNGVPSRIRLSWYDASTQPAIGETWELRVRLRAPRGFANPVGFDYEQWLFRQGIGATGYVVNHPANRILEDIPVPAVAALRRYLAERVSTVCGMSPASAVLLAVSVGARHRIGQEEWEQYAITGTSHLMAISGLHIGLAAGGAFILVCCLSAPFGRWANVRDRAALVASLTAVLYAGISGFAVPAQRAALMAVLVLAAGVLRHPLRPAAVLAAAAIAVFLADPVAILAPGYKLSFAAVAVLLWSARQRCLSAAGGDTGFGRHFLAGMQRLPPLQLTLLFGLLPLTAVLFGRVAWLAPLVNLLVLPVFNLLTVPATLLGLLLDGPLRPAGDGLLWLSCRSVQGMLWPIRNVAGWAPARIELATASGMLLPAVLLAALWAILPPGWPGRKLAWIAALSAVLARPATVPPGCLDLTVLDVGQGLAMVLQTERRSLVLDTGPAFRSGGDTGQLVVTPYLRTRGIERVDLLLVSHGDLDHAGGAGSLTVENDVAQVLSGAPLANVLQPQLQCRRGQSWVWDRVRFSIVHPANTAAHSDNDGSCVIEVAVGSYRALLTGDIEDATERRLVASASLVPVELVVVPHHGSRTSSGRGFVDRLRPQVAIVSAGFRNRWGFPHDEVVERWQRVGARVLNTALSGAVAYRFCPQDGLRALGEYRQDARKYWHDTAVD